MKYVKIISGKVIDFSSKPFQGYSPVSQRAFNMHFGQGYDIQEKSGLVEVYEGENFEIFSKRKLKEEYSKLIDQKHKNDEVVKNLLDIGKDSKSIKAQKKSDDITTQMSSMYDEAVSKYGEENVDNFLFGQNS